MNSSYFKDVNNFFVIFIEICFFLIYFDYLDFLSDIIDNSLFEHRNEAAERSTDESRMWFCKLRDAIRKKTEHGVDSGQ